MGVARSNTCSIGGAAAGLPSRAVLARWPIASCTTYDRSPLAERYAEMRGATDHPNVRSMRRCDRFWRDAAGHQSCAQRTAAANIERPSRPGEKRRGNHLGRAGDLRGKPPADRCASATPRLRLFGRRPVHASIDLWTAGAHQPAPLVPLFCGVACRDSPGRALERVGRRAADRSARVALQLRRAGARAADAPPASGTSRIIGAPRHFKGYSKILSCQATGVCEYMLQKRDAPELLRRVRRGSTPPLYQWELERDKIRGRSARSLLRFGFGPPFHLSHPSHSSHDSHPSGLGRLLKYPCRGVSSSSSSSSSKKGTERGRRTRTRRKNSAHRYFNRLLGRTTRL